MPVSRLAKCVAETEKDLPTSALQLPAPIVGHMDDGNLHITLLIDSSRPEELGEAECINQRIAARVIAMDGTCTDEHGVGLHRTGFLIIEHGNGAIDLMRSIKQALDPKHVLSPGKIFHL